MKKVIFSLIALMTAMDFIDSRKGDGRCNNFLFVED